MFPTGADLLFVAGLTSLAVAICGLMAPEGRNGMAYRLTRAGSLAVFFLCLLSLGWLVAAFIQSDFSYQIVYRNSHTDKPLFYKVAGAWGNHEGSMLLWAVIAAFYGAAFAVRPSRLGALFSMRALGAHAVLMSCFIAYLVFASDPFARLPVAPEQGLGLNPLLQDPALAFHPPMLYLGYVGFSLVFSLAVAGLLTGNLTRDWAALIHGWIAFAWSALTVGITMGSWWAYYELGWGGWWFWDPVENASLVPWLAGTALLHSAIVMQKRGTLKAWTVLLAILTFTFCLIGTFLVRSGIITSVHAFALDPRRGFFILLLVAGLCGWGLLLFALRAHRLTGETQFGALSRESLMILNNIFLFSAALTVLIGTLYPMLYELAAGSSLSVGPPYYQDTVIPLLMPLMLLIGFAPFVAWQSDSFRRILPQLKLAGLATLALLAVLLMLDDSHALRFYMGMGFAVWLAATALHHAVKTRRLSPMVLAHGGLAVALAGMVGSSHLSIDRVELLNPGQQMQLGAHTYSFTSLERLKGPNYLAERAVFTVTGPKGDAITLYPERRLYPAAAKILSEVAIHTNGLRDIYLALGDAQKDEKGRYLGWSVHAYENPLVPWIWLGCLLIALAGGWTVLRRALSALKAG